MYTVKDVCDLQSPFWITEHSYTYVEKPNRMPASSQRRLLDLCQLRNRALEERQLIVSDLIRIYQYHNKCSQCYASTIFQYLSVNEDEIVPEDLLGFVESQHEPLSLKRAGHIAMLLKLYSLAQHKMKQTEGTVMLIVEAYWSNDHEATQLVKKAQLCCSSLVIETAPIVLGTVLVNASVNDSSAFHGIELEELPDPDIDAAYLSDSSLSDWDLDFICTQDSPV